MKKIILLLFSCVAIFGQATPGFIPPYAAGGGTAQAQTVTVPQPFASYYAGMWVSWLPAAANTGSGPTLAVNGIASPPTITKCGTTALVANDLTTTAVAYVQYDGTRFQLLNPQAAACGGGGGGVSAGFGIGVSVSTVSFNPFDLSQRWTVENFCSNQVGGSAFEFSQNNNGGSAANGTALSLYQCGSTSSSGASSGNYAEYYSGAGAINPSATFTGQAWAVRNVSSTSHGAYRFGLQQQGGVGQPVCDGTTSHLCVGVVFEPGTDAHWVLRACDGSACTSQASTVTVATSTYYSFSFASSSAGTITWEINGTAQTPITTHVPNTYIEPLYQVLNSDGTQVTIEVLGFATGQQ
jgi:hypothetical protein